MKTLLFREVLIGVRIHQGLVFRAFSMLQKLLIYSDLSSLILVLMCVDFSTGLRNQAILVDIRCDGRTQW